MLKKTMLFWSILLTQPVCADVLIIGAPTQETALNYASWVNNGRPFSDMLVIVDPTTGESARFDVQFYQDWSSANAELIKTARPTLLTAATKAALVKTAQGYDEMFLHIQNLQLNYDAYNLATFSSSRFNLTNHIAQQLTAQNERLINVPLKMITPATRPDISWGPLNLPLQDKTIITITVKNNQGKLHVELHQIRDPSGNSVFPIPGTGVGGYVADETHFDELANFLQNIGYSIPPIPPTTSNGSGYTAVFTCKSDNKCDLTIRPEKNKK